MDGTNPDIWQDGPVQEIDTHISRVFLTDRFAFKLKKPVRFDFLDFSTVEQRRLACEEEVRLNRRLAPKVYLGVLPLTESGDGRIRVDGPGRVVDWVVKMRRLPEAAMLPAVMASGKVPEPSLEALASLLRRFYQAAPAMPVPGNTYRGILEKHIRGNHADLSRLCRDPVDRRRVDRIHSRQLTFLYRRRLLLDQRAAGLVDGHGDLRPEHVCLLDPPVIFDCIEFSQEFRCVDPLDELAFFLSECRFLGNPAPGDYLLRALGPVCGGHDEQLTAFYTSYRACVRAKVMGLRAEQEEPGPSRDSHGRDMARYLELAEAAALASGPQPVIAMGGLMGSGKSTLARNLAKHLLMEVISSDELRDPSRADSPPAAYGEGRYTAAGRRQIYEKMAARLTRADDGLILDASFIDPGHLELMGDVCRSRGWPLVFFECRCTGDVAMERIRRRMEKGGSASEARPELYRLQEQERASLGTSAEARTVDTSGAKEEALDQALNLLGAPDRPAEGRARQDPAQPSRETGRTRL